MIDTKNWFQLRPMYSYIRKQAENEKFMRYLEIGSTFALIAIFIFFAIMPTMSAISSLMGDIKSKQAFIKKVDLKIANVIKAQDIYSQIQEKYSLIEDSFPSLAQYHNGTVNLATIFRDSSLDIKQIAININEDEKKNNIFYKTYQINITGEGKYPSAIEAVKKLLNNRRLIDSAQIQLGQTKLEGSEQVSSQNIQFSLSSNLYFLPDNEKN